MQIVRATPQDADALTEIAHAAKRHWGYPERWIESWRDTLTIRAEFIAANVTYSAIEDDRAVGFYLLTNESDGLHLDHLWITPRAMGRGIGRALFEHALEQTRRLGHRTLKIESDPNAEGFYTRMGARRVGETVTTVEKHRRELPLLEYHLENAAIGRRAPHRPMDSKILLRKYRVPAQEIEAIGEPGDSPVAYVGEEIDSGKRVVVVVRAATLEMAVREQLEADAIAAKKLNHVNIRALYDFGVEDDHLVYVTDDFDGTLAEEWVSTYGPMPLDPVLRIALQVASALGTAGFHRIVHRAINPSNLMLLPGETAEGEWPLVKLLHFAGVARKSSGANAGAAFDKSLQYASPEQRQYGVVDFRSEIYSLGATMWFLLTGAPPPMAPDGPMTVQPTKAGLAADKVSAMPERVRRLLAKMLSVNPNARPRDPLAFYLQLQECLTEIGPREPKSRALGAPADSPTRAVGMPAHRRIPMRAVALATLFLAITALAALVLPGYLRHRRIVHATEPIRVPVGVSHALASATPAPAATHAESPAPVKSGPPQQPAESAVKVTLVSFTPMAGTPGGKDFKIATLTFKIETNAPNAPVTVTEASFYVDSSAFDDGPVHHAPITLLIHTGIFLGPPGTKVDPAHPMQRTVWLKTQENLFPNWLLAYNQTENATFRWTIGGQPVGGSVVKPLHKAWPSPRSDREVRRAEPAEPEAKRAEPAHP